MKTKIIFIILITCIIKTNGLAQVIVKNFVREDTPHYNLEYLKSVYGTNKTLPPIYEAQILIALSYFPELKDTRIEFRVKKTKTPLSARPDFFGLFKSAKKRKYVITISKETIPKLKPILLENLSFNAQIGVLGHELSHVSYYSTKGFGKMINLLCMELLSKNQVDAFESQTDLSCIEHGLGYQLLDWSKSVREIIKLDFWRGANNVDNTTQKERYLNPETIQKYIETIPIYCQE